jgi:aminopeptidase N
VKDPRVIPIAVGLLGPNGDEVQETTLLELTEAEQSFTFEGLAAKPVPSILRGFSAPVILDRETDNAERAFLLAHDTDPFCKWEAGRALARDVLLRMLNEGAAPDKAFLGALSSTLADESLDPAFVALVLALPSEDDLAQAQVDAGLVPDPQAIHAVRERMRDAMAEALEDQLRAAYAAHRVPGPYRPDADAAASRALANTALMLLSRRDGGALAQTQYDTADNMTQQLAALSALLTAGAGEAALKAFEAQWKDDRLVMDKWFSLQVAHAEPGDTAATVERLTRHPAFTMKNPNRFRAVFGAFAMNQAGFHHGSGDGYRLMADWLIELDALNPQTTARMCSAFQTWRRYDADRQALIREALERIMAKKDLSCDTAEMIGRILDA